MALVRQKLAFQKVLKGKSIKQAMLEVGYAPSTAVTTTKLTASKGWEELVNKYLPENLLLKKAKAGLDATKTRFTPEGERFIEDDYSTQHKFVETGLKLRGRLNNDDPRGDTYNFNFLTIEQQQRIARRLQAGGAEGETEPNRLPDSDEPKV